MTATLTHRDERRSRAGGLDHEFYMDLAVPIVSTNGTYIVYILDSRATVDALTGELFFDHPERAWPRPCDLRGIILPPRPDSDYAHPRAHARHAAGCGGRFFQRIEVEGQDEIGVLTRNFNHMAKVLQDTISEAENERNKLDALSSHDRRRGCLLGLGQSHSLQPRGDADAGKAARPDNNVRRAILRSGRARHAPDLKAPAILEAQKTAGDRELELFMAPFSSDQTQGGALVVIHDVTEQRKSEQSRREFVANVSHELRTPLTNIKSYAETIVSAGDELPASFTIISWALSSTKPTA